MHLWQFVIMSVLPQTPRAKYGPKEHAIPEDHGDMGPSRVCLGASLNMTSSRA